MGAQGRVTNSVSGVFYFPRQVKVALQGYSRLTKFVSSRSCAGAFLFLVLFAGCGPTPALAFDLQEERFANAIWNAEGGSKAHVPYGVETVDVGKDAAYARKICLNSIRNNRARWVLAGRPGDFISFMSKRWCPLNSVVWARNVRYFMEKSERHG